MSTITALINRVKTINLRENIEDIIQLTEPDLIDINQSQLYGKGQDALGKELKPYSFITEVHKREKGQPFDRTTLRDTGAFYSGFTIDVSQGLITFNSTDRKTPELEAKYGQQIFGLTKENKRVYSFGVFYEAVKNHITKKSGLQFR